MIYRRRNVKAFASGTKVAPEKTRMEIEAVLIRYGATGFGYMTQDAEDGALRARIQFMAHARMIRFDLNLPARSAKFRSENNHAAEVRRLWRALLLAIKAKLELVNSGIGLFESEFMAHIVMPDGKTVGEHAIPAIAQAYATGKPVALLGTGA
jgi:hypothetical protein